VEQAVVELTELPLARVTSLEALVELQLLEPRSLLWAVMEREGCQQRKT
jgi:hypothetical protein|tara:strand:- start:175 stop:321 length:147 start_codon:yes stop_codon:yes gene_type:complete